MTNQEKSTISYNFYVFFIAFLLSFIVFVEAYRNGQKFFQYYLYIYFSLCFWGAASSVDHE